MAFGSNAKRRTDWIRPFISLWFFMDSSVYVVVLCAIVLYQLLWIVHAPKIAVCIRYLCGETVMMNIYLVRVLELGLDPQHSHVMNSSCWTAFDIQLYLHVGTGVYDPFLCFHLEHVSWIYVVAIFFTGWLRQKTPACPVWGSSSKFASFIFRWLNQL